MSAASSLAANSYRITERYFVKYEESNKEVFLCKICLWTFGSEVEMSVHNYLEHLIMNKADWICEWLEEAEKE